jgi:uncharacterized protein (DUF433 family)
MGVKHYETSGRHATAFLYRMLSLLQASASVPMIDVEAHASGLKACSRLTTDIDPSFRGRVFLSMSRMDRITIEPGKRGGKPCIRGLRITVYDILEYLASGMTEDEILADFPDLEREDIRAALAFAAERERRLVSIPPA